MSERSKELQRLGLLGQTLGSSNLTLEYREGVKLQGIAVRLRGQKSLQSLHLVATRCVSELQRMRPMGLIVHWSKHLGSLI